jgi:hypothetical protein
MHGSLSRKTNRVIIAGSASVAVVLALLISQRSLIVFCGIGAGLGAVGGVLQARALSSHPAEFAKTETALDVRRALLASRDGERAIRLGWTCAFLLFVASFLLGGDLLAPARWLTGYLVFMAVRDAAAYPALRVVEAVGARSD